MVLSGDACLLAPLGGGPAVVPRAEGGAGRHRAQRAGRLTAPAAAAAAARRAARLAAARAPPAARARLTACRLTGARLTRAARCLGSLRRDKLREPPCTNATELV